MGQPFVGQLKLVGFNFAPQGWAMCSGQSLSISENDALFALLGTTFGGDGQQTFNLPNLGGRITVHAGTDASGNNYQLGEMSGVEQVTLISNQMPVHTHVLIAATDNGTINNPGNALLAGGQTIYSKSVPNKQMSATSLIPAGGSQPHENMQPFLTLTWIIALFGVFPSQT